jgi:hypothetical protein
LDEVLEEQVDDIGEETGSFAEVLVLEYGKGLLEHRIETFVSSEDVRNLILLNFK